jgi:hypothetical protein
MTDAGNEKPVARKRYGFFIASLESVKNQVR